MSIFSHPNHHPMRKLLMICNSAFAHKREIASGSDLAVGQAVSFVLEDSPKGPSAKKIEEEEGSEVVVEDESNRLYGKVKVSLP